MNKIFKISERSTTIIVILVIILTLVFIGIPYFKNAKKEEEYQKAVSKTKENLWNDATEILNNLKGYKDTNNLIHYINAKKQLEQFSNPGIKEYSLVFDMLKKIDDNYNGDLKEEIRSFKQDVSIKIEANKEKQERIKLEQDKKDSIKRAVELIKTGQYSDASIMVVNYKDNDSECLALYHYASALEYKEKFPDSHSMEIDELAKIPMEYSGVLADEIRAYKLKFMNKSEWNEKFVYETDMQKRFEEEQRKPSPQIGMTALEVIGSKWGKPEDINRTTTVNGVSEQWVYPGYKYIYLENGIVTAIQE